MAESGNDQFLAENGKLRLYERKRNLGKLQVGNQKQTHKTPKMKRKSGNGHPGKPPIFCIFLGDDLAKMNSHKMQINSENYHFVNHLCVYCTKSIIVFQSCFGFESKELGRYILDPGPKCQQLWNTGWAK